jgi:hypothetical protein
MKEIPMAVTSISGTVYTSSAETQTVWSEQQLTLLKSLLSQNEPLDEIAVMLKRSPAAIKLEAAALGLNVKTK